MRRIPNMAVVLLALVGLASQIGLANAGQLCLRFEGKPQELCGDTKLETWHRPPPRIAKADGVQCSVVGTRYRCERGGLHGWCYCQK